MNNPSEAINLVNEVSRRVRVDFLYLDNKTCTRCGKTGENLEQAVAMLTPPLKAAGIELVVRHVHIDSLDAAERHRFESSPTIRVDGRDIAGTVSESNCSSCGDTCGCDGVQCRVWRYRGQEQDHAPLGLIVNAILAAAYQNCAPYRETQVYEVPENLKRFFAGANGRKAAATCCG